MRFLVVFSLLSMLIGTGARAQGPFVGFELGAGDLDMGDVTLAPGFDVSLGTRDNTLVLTVSGGYEFASGLFVIGEIDSTDQATFLNLTDSVELDAFKVGIGYGGPAGQPFRVHAIVGMSFWELEGTESFFFNPGPEATGSLDGEDIYFNVGAEYSFNENFSATLQWNYNEYDFGDATATRLGVRWRFGSP